MVRLVHSTGAMLEHHRLFRMPHCTMMVAFLFRFADVFGLEEHTHTHTQLQALLLISLMPAICSQGTSPSSTTTTTTTLIHGDRHPPTDEQTCSHAPTTKITPFPWVEITSPKSAQLFLEGNFEEIRLRYRVHGVALGQDKAMVWVYVIK